MPWPPHAAQRIDRDHGGFLNRTLKWTLDSPSDEHDGLGLWPWVCSPEQQSRLVDLFKAWNLISGESRFDFVH